MTSTDTGLITAAAVQAVATIVLVGVTISYAISTKRQADANVKMAKEMKKQTEEDYKPLLKLEAVRIVDDEQTEKSPYKIKITIKNIGRGPALHTEVKFIHSKFDFGSPLPDAIIEIGEVISLNLEQNRQESDAGISPEVIARYQNIYGKDYSARLTYNQQHPRLEYTEKENSHD